MSESTSVTTATSAETPTDSADPRSSVQLSAFRRASHAPKGSTHFPGVTLEHLHLQSWRTPEGALLLHIGTEEVLLPPEGFINLTLFRSSARGPIVRIDITSDTGAEEWKFRLTSVGSPERWREYGPPKACSSRPKPRQQPSPAVRASNPSSSRHIDRRDSLSCVYPQ